MAKFGVIVDAYSTGRFLPSELAQHGIDCVHVHSNPGSEGYFVKSFLDGTFVADYGFDGDLAQLAAQVGAHDPAFVIAGSEPGVPLADRLAEAVGLPGNGTAQSLARRNKHAMASALRGARVVIPS